MADISPLLANLYLHWFDRAVYGENGPAKWAKVELVRYADLILQVLHLSAQGRLRDSKARGGFSEVQDFAHRQKSIADVAIPSLKSIMPQKHGSARNVVLAG